MQRGCCKENGEYFVACSDCMDEHNYDCCAKFRRRNAMVMATENDEGKVEII